MWGNIKDLLKLRLETKKIKYLFLIFLLHALSYSYTRLTRLDLFKVTAKPKYGYITKLLNKINTLVSLGFEQAKACEIVANSSNDKYLKGFLLRYSQSIKVGEDVTDFLLREYESNIIIYTSEYERAMDRIKRLSEAYVAVLTSTVFILITLSFMEMMWGTGLLSSLWPLTSSMTAIYAGLNFMFYQLTPYDKFIIDNPKDKVVSVVQFSSKIILIFAITSLIIYFVLTILNIISPNIFPLIMLVIGVPMFALGSYGIRIIKRIRAIDENFMLFISTLASSMSSLGASIKDALRDIERIDFGILNNYIRNLKMRLDVGVDNRICWKLFIKESSSELMSTYGEIFHETYKAGAPPSKIGELMRKSLLNFQTLRKRRDEVSTFIRGLLLPLHPALSAMLALTLAIIIEFMNSITTLQSSNFPIEFITPISIDTLRLLFYIMIIIITVSNAIIMYFINSNHTIGLTYYLGLFFLEGILTFYIVFELMRAFIGSLIGGIKI